MNKELEMTPNVLMEFLQKPASEFTKEDIIRYIYEKDIQMVNFMYPAGDGRLKTLNFVINNVAYLDAILTCGERVDGSSLFPFPYGFRGSVCGITYAYHALLILQ